MGQQPSPAAAPAVVAIVGAGSIGNDPWTPELVGPVVQERHARLPLDRWAKRVA